MKLIYRRFTTRNVLAAVLSLALSLAVVGPALAGDQVGGRDPGQANSSLRNRYIPRSGLKQRGSLIRKQGHPAPSPAAGAAPEASTGIDADVAAGTPPVASADIGAEVAASAAPVASTGIDAEVQAESLASPAPADGRFDAFVASVADGRAGVLRGVYVDGLLALRVVQQPAGSPYYVDLTLGNVTQFRMASDYGVTGLLADNIASGTKFTGLGYGQEVRLVYGDGSVRRYQVSAVYRYQALQPTDPYSNFLDLNSGEQIPASSLFGAMYTGGDHVTFQTCIAQDGIMAWGRLFVVATPMQ